VAQNRLNLLASHAGKPLKEIIHPRAIFQVLEQRLDRHSCALEDPGTADLPRGPFDRRTLTPVKHGAKLQQATGTRKRPDVPAFQGLALAVPPYE